MLVAMGPLPLAVAPHEAELPEGTAQDQLPPVRPDTVCVMFAFATSCTLLFLTVTV